MHVIPHVFVMTTGYMLLFACVGCSCPDGAERALIALMIANDSPPQRALTHAAGLIANGVGKLA